MGRSGFFGRRFVLILQRTTCKLHCLWNRMEKTQRKWNIYQVCWVIRTRHKQYTYLAKTGGRLPCKQRTIATHCTQRLCPFLLVCLFFSSNRPTCQTECPSRRSDGSFLLLSWRQLITFVFFYFCTLWPWCVFTIKDRNALFLRQYFWIASTQTDLQVRWSISSGSVMTRFFALESASRQFYFTWVLIDLSGSLPGST